MNSYSDFPGADPHDGQQLPADQHGNAITTFEKAPSFSVADYYDRSRSRTYACCFSLENSDYNWRTYANGSTHGKVCVVFHFGKLRATLNETVRSDKSILLCCGLRCKQIFSINYGIVEYVEWDQYQANSPHLPNPLTYTYLKDREKFAKEKELRVSLIAPPAGRFVLDDGREIEFPPSFAIPFNFRAAIEGGAVQEILRSPDDDPDFLLSELQKFRIVPSG